MLEVRNLSVSFKNQKVLEDFNLSCPKIALHKKV